MKTFIITACLVVLSSQAFASAGDYYNPNPSVQPYIASPPSTPRYEVPSYQAPTYDTSPVDRGSIGYNGITGRADTRYIPAGRDPNPPVNVLGNQKLGGN